MKEVIKAGEGHVVIYSNVDSLIYYVGTFLDAYKQWKTISEYLAFLDAYKQWKITSEDLDRWLVQLDQLKSLLERFLASLKVYDEGGDKDGSSQ